MGAMDTLAVIWLAALPLAGKVAGGGKISKPVVELSPVSLRQTVKDALHDRDYLLLNLGFFTCGFHIAFLTTHLPTEIGLCGLPPTVASTSLALIGGANIFGSIWVGHLVGRYRSKMILALMYASRAVLIGWYLMMPHTTAVFYVFAIGLGLTWLATVPPTACIVGKLFNVRFLGTLFGLTLFTHQIGGFLGAWLGGLALDAFNSYDPMWWADIALALLAAAINLPIREARVRRQLARA
jgi:predicted MFS family arabinose efflux permease